MITNTTEFTKTVYMSMEGKNERRMTTMLKIQKNYKISQNVKNMLENSKENTGSTNSEETQSDLNNGHRLLNK